MASEWLTQLGDSGIEVSRLGLGTVKFGRNQGVRYPTEFELPSSAELKRLLDAAHEFGINYLDTAPAYGTSESRIGELIAKQRHEWVISTKAGEFFSDQKSHYDYSRQATFDSVERSLKQLKTDFLDIVFVHSNGDDESIVKHEPVLDCLAELKQKGLVRAVGYSGKALEGSLLAIPQVDVFMVTLNESDRSQTKLIEQCQQRNKGVVIKKALNSGHAGSPAQAIQFSAQHPGVNSVIVGTIDPEHLKQNISALRAS